MDSDKNYLNKCLEYYKNNSLKAYGYILNESKYEKIVLDLIEKHRPDIVVITGHDAKYINDKDAKKYKNSDYFISCVKRIRSKYKNIVIFAGACQSDFINLIKAGATYASSPSHVNIHALDPAIVAAFVALTDRNEVIDTEIISNKTKYGSDGVGGIISTGTMTSVFPRKEDNIEYNSSEK